MRGTALRRRGAAGRTLFPARAPEAEAPLKLREHLEQIERDLLLACLRRNAGNQTLAARELGLPRRTLIYRMGRLNIHFGDPRT